MKVYYHDDLDGRGAAALFERYYNNSNNEEIEFINVTHNPKSDKEKLEMVKENERVIIVDYSFSNKTKENLDNILEKTINVIWIDHHATSLELVENYPEYNNIRGIINTKYSGAYLVYLYLKCLDLNHKFIRNNYELDFDENTVPYFIKLIDDYDCWKKKLADSDFFKLGMDTIDHTPKATIWKELCSDKSKSIEVAAQLAAKGRIIKKYLDHYYLDCRSEGGYISEFEGITCYCMNSYGNSWVFGDEYNKFDLVILYNFDGELFCYSLYSKNHSKVNCAKLAEKYGGGGHPGAAGFSSPELVVKKVYKEKDYTPKNNAVDSVLF